MVLEGPGRRCRGSPARTHARKQTRTYSEQGIAEACDSASVTVRAGWRHRPLDEKAQGGRRGRQVYRVTAVCCLFACHEAVLGAPGGPTRLARKASRSDRTAPQSKRTSRNCSCVAKPSKWQLLADVSCIDAKRCSICLRIRINACSGWPSLNVQRPTASRTSGMRLRARTALSCRSSLVQSVRKWCGQRWLMREPQGAISRVARRCSSECPLVP